MKPDKRRTKRLRKLLEQQIAKWKAEDKMKEEQQQQNETTKLNQTTVQTHVR